MHDPDVTRTKQLPGHLASLPGAFAEAFWHIQDNHTEVDPSSLFPSLHSIASDLAGLPDSPSPPDLLLSAALKSGQEFCQAGRGLALDLAKLLVLACKTRDLFKSHGVLAHLGRSEEADAFLETYFDTLLRGVAVEWARLEAAAFHTQLRDANRFILQERRRYYSIFKRMVEPAFIIDREMRLLETNRAFDSLFQLKGKRHIGKNCYDVLGEEFREACLLDDFLHSTQGRSGVEIDLLIHGESRSIIVNGTFLGDINHESSGGIVILQDNTSRRAIERALQESEQQYRSLIENVPDVTWRLNQDGDFVFISPNAQEIYGYSASEMLGQGSVQSLLDSSHSTQERGGEGVRLGRIHPDDVDVVRNELRLFFSSHLRADAATPCVHWPLPQEGRETGRSYDVKYRFQKKDGRWVWIHERACRIDSQDGECYADGISSDITDLKQAEAELERHHFRLAEIVDERTVELKTANKQLKKEIDVRRQTEQALRDLTTRLADSNRELEQFAHVASHDLKEPLMLIVAFSERLIKKYSAQLEEKAQEYLRRISMSADHMRQLVDGFLALSLVTTGAAPYEEVDLADLVQEVVQSLEERIKESDARIEIGELGRLGGDRLQLRQLFQNIIANALKYRKMDGRPLVVLRGSLVDEAHYEIMIQDNGIGFDPKDAEKIFRPLQRLHSRRDYEGTGMGLTTCQKIVARHGGEIWAQGSPGQGATFVIRLPVSLLR
ncbi:MAG: PAS domain S-box protein [Desulfobulbaceae bacterium]|nr:PAS domain S-box protein [Desulfobulbaceae bacterium]